MKQRTNQQNRALHLWCTQLAEALNDAGLDMKVVLKPEIDIPWTTQNVKNHIWRPVQQALLQKDSTTELNTYDPSEVYETINRHLSEKFGVSVPWPSLETLRDSQHEQHPKAKKEAEKINTPIS